MLNHINQMRAKTIYEFERGIDPREILGIGPRKMLDDIYKWFYEEADEEEDAILRPIKDYKKSSTCSKPCSQIYFKDKFLNTSKNRDMSWVGENYKGPSYSLICFKYHKHKCIICDEDLAVDVHHYDKNDKNNKKENLVPLCATHHRYMHNKNYIYIIKECVDEYVFKFRKKLMVERNQ